MRLRNAAAVAARVIAIYIAFQAMIYTGELAHDLIRHRPLAVLARSFVPITAMTLVALTLWMRAARIAAALAAGAGDTTEEPPASSRDLGAIAFGVTGLVIAAQAGPLFASTIQRLVGGVWSHDATGDTIAAATRIGLGTIIFFNARRLSRAVIKEAPASSLR